MTLDQYITNCQRAVAANFQYRNTKVFSDARRQHRVQSERRQEIRRWIAEIRRANNPNTAAEVAAAVLWVVN